MQKNKAVNKEKKIKDTEKISNVLLSSNNNIEKKQTIKNEKKPNNKTVRLQQ